MNFRRYAAILAIFLVAVLVAQPVLSAENMTEVISAKNVANVTNQTSDLEKDEATRYFNYAQTQLAGCNPETCDYGSVVGLYDQALALNTTMLKKTDALQYLYQGKAYALIQMAKYNEAVSAADEGLSFYPRDSMLWNNKGFALSGLGKDQEALAAYDQAISIDGNYTNALLNRANLLNKMGRYSEAVSAFTRANETDPFNINASDGLIAARKGEAGSGQTTTLLLMVFVVVAAGIAIWYVKFRKPSEPAPEEKKKKRSKKKE